MRKASLGGDAELAFLRVLHAISEAEAQAGVDMLDHADRAMLYHIALNEGAGGSIKMTDLAKGGAFGTLPTVLSRVARLVEQGWVDKDVNPEDGRSRVVSTSSRSRKFFQKASKAVVGAVGG